MGRRRKKRIKRSHPPGTLPGTLVAHEEADAAPVQIFLFSYDPDHCEERSLRPDEIASLTVPDNGVLWIDIWGLADPGVVKAVAIDVVELQGVRGDAIDERRRAGIGQLA